MNRSGVLTSNTPPRLTPRVIAGIMAITAATLFLQIALTKFFSFRLWYHYAFMIISITMLGLSAASVALAQGKITRQYADRALTLSASLFGTTMLAALGLLVSSGDLLLRTGGQWTDFLGVAGCWMVLFPPFFFAGTVVSWAIDRYSAQVSLLYAMDLVGAGTGCLIAVVALSVLSAEQCIALASGLGFVAALLFLPDSSLDRRTVVPLVAGLLVAAAVATLGFETWGVRITPSKGLAMDLHSGGRIAASAPGMNGRVDVVAGSLHDFAWGLSHLYTGSVPEQFGVRIDGDALTSITRFDPAQPNWPFTDYMPASLPYVVAHPNSVLVIGAGGGMDLVNAVTRGARRVVGVEINRQIIDFMNGPFRDFSGGIYAHPNVEIAYSDGRTYVERTTEKFDVIQLTLVDTFAAISSGALALSEDFLYTTEAFGAYIDHLSPNGILTLGRTREESLSLLTLLDAATRPRGITLRDRVFIARAHATHGLVLLFQRSLFTVEQIAVALQFVHRNGMELVYAPDSDRSLPEVKAFVTADHPSMRAASIGRDLTPETDDAPFYFRQSKWRQLLGTYSGGKGNLLVILGVALIFGAAFILFPLRQVAPAMAPTSMLTVSYFGLLGLGYIILESALLVKFTLFLGHPTRSLTVTLFSLLFFSGIGARLSERFSTSRPHWSLAPLAGVVILSSVYAIGLSPVIERTMSLPLAARILMTSAVIAPLGFMMGMPLPTGVTVLRQREPQLVLWAWGLNGFCSVVGPVIAIITAQAAGYRATIGLAVLMYLMASVVLWRVMSRSGVLRPQRRPNALDWT
jgi:hypothetical protein